MDNLRKSLLKAMKAQDEVKIRQASERICEQVEAFLKPGMCVGFYMAMSEEVQLEGLRKKLQDLIQCAIPRITAKGVMSFYKIDKETTLVKNKWGIVEPVDAVEIAPKDFDIMLVPMVGFDEQKHRIGHGAGYYDRYLAKTSALKIGIAFELQKCDHLITNPHDIDMDMIITESNVYK